MKVLKETTYTSSSLKYINIRLENKLNNTKKAEIMLSQEYLPNKAWSFANISLLHLQYMLSKDPTSLTGTFRQYIFHGINI